MSVLLEDILADDLDFFRRDVLSVPFIGGPDGAIAVIEPLFNAQDWSIDVGFAPWGIFTFVVELEVYMRVPRLPGRDIEGPMQLGEVTPFVVEPDELHAVPIFLRPEVQGSSDFAFCRVEDGGYPRCHADDLGRGEVKPEVAEEIDMKARHHGWEENQLDLNGYRER